MSSSYVTVISVERTFFAFFQSTTIELSTGSVERVLTHSLSRAKTLHEGGHHMTRVSSRWQGRHPALDEVVFGPLMIIFTTLGDD